MDRVLERIAALKNSFNTHDSVTLFDVRLESLELLNTSPPLLSLAVVKAVAKPEFMVYSDLKCGKITQGGISFAIANFAGVYAAMVHTEKHTPLCRSRMEFLGPIKEGDEIVAKATAQRMNNLIIKVDFEIFGDNERKLFGNAHYRDDKKK